MLLMARLGVDGVWNVWLALEPGDPRTQNESMVLSCASSERGAWAQAAERLMQLSAAATMEAATGERWTVDEILAREG